jgi:hypothetical protein
MKINVENISTNLDINAKGGNGSDDNTKTLLKPPQLITERLKEN